MTLKAALDYGKKVLEEAKIAEFNLEAWLLLEFVTRINRASYFGNQEQEMQQAQWIMYQELIKERSKRIPLQHLTGVQEFMGFVFQVNENVLIPRQDTEVLVETTLDYIPKDLTRRKDRNQKLKVLDVCTGSGCILISLMKMRDTIEGVGIDISKEALEIATINKELNEVECLFVESDLFEKIEGEFDVIVSNPPYISTKEIEALEEEVKLYDPMLALDGKEDGLYFYRKIIQEAPKYLKEDGVLLFEIGQDQGQVVSEFMIENRFKGVRIKKDLAGLDRVVYGHVQ